MSFGSRSPIYDPIQPSPKHEEPIKKTGFESSPLSRFIGSEDMILVWTGLAIIILISGVFIYFNYGPGSEEIIEEDYDEEVVAVGDDGEVQT